GRDADPPRPGVRGLRADRPAQPRSDHRGRRRAARPRDRRQRRRHRAERGARLSPADREAAADADGPRAAGGAGPDSADAVAGRRDGLQRGAPDLRRGPGEDRERPQAARAMCEHWLERSPAIVTALAPRIGYAAAAQLAKEAVARNVTVRQLVRDKGLLSDEELDRVLDLRAMTEPGVPGEPKQVRKGKRQ